MSHLSKESAENGYLPPFYQREMSFDSRHLTGLLQCLVHVCDHRAMSLCISPLWNAIENKLCFFPVSLDLSQFNVSLTEVSFTRYNAPCSTSARSTAQTQFV